MADSLLDQAERLAQQCRATLDSPVGSPLRIEKMISEHRQLVVMLEHLIAFIRGFLQVHQHLSRLVKRLLDAFSTGSNGSRTWIRGIHPAGKTALVLIQQFLQRRR